MARVALIASFALLACGGSKPDPITAQIPTAPSASTSATASSTSPSTSTSTPAITEITPVGPYEYDVPFAMADSAVGDQGSLMRQARFVPAFDGKTPIGLKLYGVRPDTFIGKLGLRNGDLLEAVNGAELTTPEKAAEIYAGLKGANHVVVRVRRQGEAVTFTYHVK